MLSYNFAFTVFIFNGYNLKLGVEEWIPEFFNNSCVSLLLVGFILQLASFTTYNSFDLSGIKFVVRKR